MAKTSVWRLQVQAVLESFAISSVLVAKYTGESEVVACNKFKKADRKVKSLLLLASDNK